MFNPFIGEPYIESAEALYERQDQLNLLRAFFRDRADAVVFGPEGSGKSVLLRCFFNLAFRRKMARKNTLIYLGEFPKNLDSEATYGYFADAIRTSVEFLEFCDQSEQMTVMLRSLDAVQFDTKQSRFDQYLNKIRNFGFRMVFVLDNFENFTSSPDVKPEHHDLLCGMLNDDKLQLIVASNYDFNETSLPVGTRNSKLLTRLSPHSIHMTPLSADACQSLLDRVAEEEEDDFRFTAAQIQTLHSLSGGIPLLLHMAAKHGFTALQEGEADFAEAVRQRTLQEALPILKHWCKVTPEEQLDLLAALTENCELPEAEQTVASALQERGLLVKGYTLGRDGRRIAGEGYTYNSGLFRDFCGHREWLDAVLENNPLRKEDAPAAAFDPLAFLSGNAGAPIYINEVTLHQGDTYDHSVKNTVTYQPTVIAEKGFARLFDILDLRREDLGSKLLEIFDSPVKALPEAVDADTAAEETAERITSIFIPEEVENDNLEECREEQKTLESRFNAIRSQVDPEGLVDDGLLNSLSVKCRLYLQIAFVVDDALSALNDFHLGDLSAQMVMYGKVLEQQLKDNLYPLFQKEATLKDIDVFTNCVDPYSRATFGNMKLHKTCIGNYMSIMRYQANRLAKLCSDHGVCYENQSPDALWWKKLGDDVDVARDLRNGGDHAGTETSQIDLTGMRQLLFGSGEILRRCGTGAMLTQAIWPPKPKVQPQPASPALDSAKAALVGQTVTMTDIEMTSRKSLRGTVAGTSYGVSISRKHLMEKHCYPQDLVGKTVQVKLIRWDDNPSAQKFTAELL